jgi:hypothetical protein
MRRKWFSFALIFVLCFGLTVPTFADTSGSMNDSSGTPPPAIYPHTIGEVGGTVITDTSGREWKLSQPIIDIKEVTAIGGNTFTAYVVPFDTHVTVPTMDIMVLTLDYEGMHTSLSGWNANYFNVPYDFALSQELDDISGIAYLGGSMSDTTTGVYFYAVANGGSYNPDPATPANVANIAKPTASTILVNGENVAFDAYNISGNNHFKLRDLAYILNGTEKQFEVGYDTATKAITLTSGAAYTEAGGEMEGKGAGDKTPTATTSKITLDGADVSFTAYNIDGNNYFKLRDIGAAFDFGVDWDGAKNTIIIDTSKGYTPE